MKQNISNIFKSKKVNMGFDLPILASINILIPIFTGYFTNNLREGMIAALAGIMVVYFPIFGNFKERIIVLLSCSFGFIISYTIGLLFSFNKSVDVIILGITSMFIHYIILHFEIKPPRSFFFIMLCSLTSSIPHLSIHKIAGNIGFFVLGTMSTSLVAFLYSFFHQNKNTKNVFVAKNEFNLLEDKNNKIESVIVGIFMSISLMIGFLLKIKNPYWICVSCISIMQGSSAIHVFYRSIQRMIGTLVGVGLFGLILLIANESLFFVCVSIVVLQFIVEYLVPRNYTIAVIFITPMTILLSEMSNFDLDSHSAFMISRFGNTLIGSLLGLIGGWLIYKRKNYKI